MEYQALPFSEPATGLVYARRRWYDPSTGTFLSPDPAGYNDSSNLYAYCGGDPVNCTDPTGMWGESYKKLGASLAGYVVGVAENVIDTVNGLNPIVSNYRTIKAAVPRAKRVAAAYRGGGASAAARQYGAEVQDHVTGVVQGLPIINTIRQAEAIPEAYEAGDFEGGRQVGRTTVSLAGDVTVVYGGVKGVQAARANTARARGAITPELEVVPTPETVPPRRSGTTRQGVTRNNQTGWRGLRDLWDEMGYDDILSDANRELIAKGRTPVVDEAWMRHFPGDATLIGEQITLHHIGGGKISVPLPKSRHIDAHKPGGFRRNPGGPGTSG